jgi:hypothetical protein
MSESVDSCQTQTKLTAKQLKAIPVLLAARSVADGCRAAKISRETFYAWRQESDFKGEYERQSRDLVQEAFRSLKLLGNEAVEVLAKLLKSRNESIRFRTAVSIIESTTKFIELEDIEKRLEALERRVNGEH